MKFDLTVLVTNFGRADKLHACLDSLTKAGIGNVVVSTTCPDDSVRAALTEFKEKFLSFLVVSTDLDFGNNEAWLRGAYHVRTKYMLIMHDDDRLEPEFGSVYKELIQPNLERGVGIASWHGRAEYPDGTSKFPKYHEGPTQVLSSGVLTRHLLRENGHPVSPVVSVFRRSDVIRGLKEAAEVLNDASSFTRPTMMLGNELLMYLRAAERHHSWLFINKVLSVYGAWEGSETVKQTRGPRSTKAFLDGYNFARQVFLKTRGSTVKTKPRLIHVYSHHEPTDEGSIRRYKAASRTWKFQHDLGNMLSFAVGDTSPRTSDKIVGDKRALPFVSDLIQVGVNIATPGDLVCMTNNDTCLTRGFTDWMRSHPIDAGYVVRHDFFHPIEPTTAVLTNIDNLGRRHCGADLLTVTPRWWNEHREIFPDMFLGYEAWDLIARELFQETQPNAPHVELPDMVYHEYHATFWSDQKNRYSHPAQLYNLRIAKNFYRSRGRDLHFSLKENNES